MIIGKVFDALDAAIAEMHVSLGLKHIHDLDKIIKDISRQSFLVLFSHTTNTLIAVQTYTLGMKQVTASLDEMNEYIRGCYSLTTALESFKDTEADEPSDETPMDGTPTWKELDDQLVTDVRHVQALVANLEQEAQTSEHWLLAFLGEGYLAAFVVHEEEDKKDFKKEVKEE